MRVLIGHARSADHPQANQVEISDWSASGWHSVFRAVEFNVASKIADCAVKICNNNLIGYSQSQRSTLWNQVSGKGFDPSTVTTPCYTDCSAFVAVCCAYAGVPIPASNTTSTESANLMNTGRFAKITEGANSASTYVRGDILLRSGHTAVVVDIQPDAVPSPSVPSQPATPSPVVTPVAQKKYEFKKYSLSDSNIKQLAAYFNYLSTSLKVVMAYASVLVNCYESSRYVDMDGTDSDKLFNYFLMSDMFPQSSNATIRNRDVSDVYINAVKQVIVTGDRVLPLFVDSFAAVSEITRVTTNGITSDKNSTSSYIKDNSQIVTVSGKSFKFWTFPDTNSPAFGYTDENLRREWDSYLLDSYVTGVPQQVSVDWTKLRPYLIYVSRYTIRKLNYADLMYNHGVIGVMFEAGGGTRYENFRNPKLYDQVRYAMSSGCPFGYVFFATARSTREANLEMENLFYIVNHYSPSLGVWVDVSGLHSGKSTNDSILDVYESFLIRYGLKNKIGIRASRSELSSKLTWMNFQERWYLWLIDRVSSSSELSQLLDPTFFDTDNQSGPVMTYSSDFVIPGSISPSYNRVTALGSTQARDMFALGDIAYNEATPSSTACQNWISTVAGMVAAANQNYRVKASLVIATIITESGWMHTPNNYKGDGSTLSENNNVMGINDSPSLIVEGTNWYTYKTSKMFSVPQWNTAGQLYYHEEKMKTYRCVEDCIEDFIAFMCKNHPEFKGNNNIEAYADWFQHYTPNPHERTIDRRKRTIDKFNLERFDLK